MWQALKYVSYCASLTRPQILEIYQEYLDAKGESESAEEKILAFLDASDLGEVLLNGGDQRMILVAANFRKEVTSTVLWLLDHDINVKCIRVTPYQDGNNLYLDTEQMLPIPDTEALRIKKQESYKEQEKQVERHKLLYEFWAAALPELQTRAGIYINVSPTKDNWIGGASGHSGISYQSVVGYRFARAELSLERIREDNKEIFDQLYAQKETLESAFGKSLNWRRMDDNIASRISIQLDTIDLTDREQWPELAAFLGDHIGMLRKVLSGPLQEAVASLKA